MDTRFFVGNKDQFLKIAFEASSMCRGAIKAFPATQILVFHPQEGLRWEPGRIVDHLVRTKGVTITPAPLGRKQRHS